MYEYKKEYIVAVTHTHIVCTFISQPFKYRQILSLNVRCVQYLLLHMFDYVLSEIAQIYFIFI